MTHVLSAVAWPYANGPRHIGHVAGFGVPSDVFSRYMRMAGHDVLMVSGTDEHGTPILVQAEKEGVTPRELADRYNRRDRRGPARARAVLRPVHPDHDAQPLRRRAGAVPDRAPQRLHDRADDASARSRRRPAAPCPTATSRAPARSAATTAPAATSATTAATSSTPIDLINPRSRINGETPEFVETEHFFLDLPALAEALGRVAARRGPDWRPNVLKFSLNLLDDMRPRAMTRDIDWGIPVPLPGWEDNPNKRLYVWFDAVIGYLSASIEWARRSGDPDAWRAVVERPGGARPTTSWARTTSPSTPRSGRPSCSATTARAPRAATPGEFGELNLPTEVVVSEFLTMEGKQVLLLAAASSSTSATCWRATSRTRCATSSPSPGPENQDTDFTWAEFVRRTNDELVAGWGNLVNRTASMIHKNFGAIPPRAS